MLLAVDLGPQTLALVGIYLVCLVLSIAVHEYCHAFAADRLGDPTPASEGRLTLNPLAHADPVGTLLLPVVAALFRLPLLGWGKPVQTSPTKYTRKVSMRFGMAIVAAAGPAGNLALASAVVGVAAIAARIGALDTATLSVAVTLIELNLVLMLFNLIPLHPLDGGKILTFLLPARAEAIDEWSAQWGGIVVVMLVVAGGPILTTLFWPARFVTELAVQTLVLSS